LGAVLATAGCTSPATPPTSASTTASSTTTTGGAAPSAAIAPAATPTSTPDGRNAVLPDPAFTPGATNPAVTQATISTTICTSGWTATVRPPETYTEHIKHLEVAAGGTATYQGVTYPVHGFDLADPNIAHYELDHLVALEVGGAPADPANLWMEPYEAPKGTAPPGTGSQTKDEVENAARAAVCAGRITLADAQHQIAADWAALGRRLGVPRTD
jgi:hypothetical protein